MGIETTAWALGGRPCLRPSEGYRGAARANSYTCPIGPAFGRAWVLMRRRDLDAMKKKGELDEALSLDVRSGKKALHFPRMYFIKAVNVSGGPKNSRDAAYLCELVDVRYVMARSSSLNLAVNVVKQLGGEDYDEARALADRSGSESAAADQYGVTRYAYGTTSFNDENNPDSPYTWAELFTIVWRGLNGGTNSRRELFYTEPELPWEPAGVPENYVATAANRWKFYNDLLAKFSWALAYNPVADDFSIVEMGAVQPGLFKAEAKLVPRWDADPVEPNLTAVPGIFETLAKQQLPHHGLHDAGYWRSSVRGVPIHEYEDGVVAERSVGRFLRYKGKDGLKLWDYQGFRTLWDNGAAPYQTGLGSTVGTGVEAVTRAEREASERFKQIVDAIVVDEKTPLARRVYSGIVPTFMPGSRVKCMAWRQTATDGVVTEVIQHPGLPRLDADGEWLGRDETPQEFRAPDLPGVPTTFAFALIDHFNDVRIPRGGYTTKFGGGAPQGWNKSYKNSGYFLAVCVMHDGVLHRLVSGVPDSSQTGSSGDNRYWKPDRIFPSASIEPGSYEKGQQICWVRFVDCPTAPVLVRGGSNYDLNHDLDRSYVGHGRLNGSQTIDGVTLPLLLSRNDCVNAMGTIVLASGNAYWALLAGGGSVVVRVNGWHLPSGIVARFVPGDKVFLTRIGCAWVVVSSMMPGICDDSPGNLVKMCVGEAETNELGGNEDSWEGVVIGPDGEVVIPDGGGGVFEEGTEVLEGEFGEEIGP